MSQQVVSVPIFALFKALSVIYLLIVMIHR